MTTPSKQQVAPKFAGKPQTNKLRTKQQRLIDALRRPQGATIEKLSVALGWQHHTIRGVISGSLKKKLGLTITTEKTENGRVYRITKGGAEA